MDIVISGYGKMGKVIEKAALDRGHRIKAILDRPEDWDSIPQTDFAGSVVLEFSIPNAAAGNIRRCFDLKVPVVVGTTGWNDRLAEVRQWTETEGQALFFASNYSIGVNLMFEVTRQLSAMLNTLPGYDISLWETHHIHKLDAPSGTAIRLAEIILENYRAKKEWVNREAAGPEELAIISRREDEIAGIHSFVSESKSDKLVITHEAKDRTGFANGAIMAAEWMRGKTGFFTMKDLLFSAG
jgi:4-hydroxy-tetrahydrodipicolinate reductase